MDLAAGGIRWRLSVGPADALVAQAHSPVGGALLVAGAFLSLLFAMLVYLVQRSGGRTVVEAINAGQDLSGTLAIEDANPLILSYDADGRARAWNEIAGRLFVSGPPAISPSRTGFRTVRATVLWCAAPAESLEGLRRVLDSCTQSALLFDGEGRFIAANGTADRMLGWTDATWAGREARPSPSVSHDALRIQTVTILQGRWTAVAAPNAATAASAAIR
jgi:PAS domain-containing protein